MSNIYGTIGFSLLQNQDLEIFYKVRPKYILVLADIHSKLPYCDNQINITDWFYKNKDKTNIFLEEVIRNENIKLKELWGESEHTVQLKKFFLSYPEIVHATDFRPYLIPYSWEMASIVDKNYSLEKYLLLLNQFFNFEDKFSEYEKLLDNKIITKHFNLLKKNFNQYLEKYSIFLNYEILELTNVKKEILEEINDLLDDIMEWYTIAKIFSIDPDKNIIIHTGLFHSSKIICCLHSIYNYKIINQDGINKIEDLEEKKINSGCINLPKFIEDQLFLFSN